MQGDLFAAYSLHVSSWGGYRSDVPEPRWWLWLGADCVLDGAGEPPAHLRDLPRSVWDRDTSSWVPSCR